MELQLQCQSFHEYSGWISFRIDWFCLHAVQGTLRSLLQHQFESINSLVLRLFYGLSHLYTTTRKTIALTIQTLYVHQGSLYKLLSWHVAQPAKVGGDKPGTEAKAPY